MIFYIYMIFYNNLIFYYLKVYLSRVGPDLELPITFDRLKFKLTDINNYEFMKHVYCTFIINFIYDMKRLVQL